MKLEYVTKEYFFSSLNARDENVVKENGVLVVIGVDGKASIDNHLTNLITKYDNLTNDFHDIKHSFQMSKKIPNYNVLDNNPFCLLQCKKFSYNTVKYSDVQLGLMNLANDYEKQNKSLDSIYIIIDTFMDKGIVKEEMEKNIKKALRSKTNLKVFIVE